jgi:hypothetical protein
MNKRLLPATLAHEPSDILSAPPDASIPVFAMPCITAADLSETLRWKKVPTIVPS